MNTIIVNLIVLTLSLTPTQGMVLRNKALINRMVSHFQGKDNNLSAQSMQHQTTQQTESQNVISLMQKVLCRNFPSIPCNLIIQDVTLKKLIEKSIQQIKYKRFELDKTTSPTLAHLSLFPVVNTEDLSNFLQVSDTGHPETKPRKDRKHTTKEKHTNEKNKRKKNRREEKVIPVYNGRKKIRKFYPHKIKYKEKSLKKFRKDFGDYSEEKLSMSVEVEGNGRAGLQLGPGEPPAWRIDYLKHGEPTFNMFGHETDRLKGKIVKPGQNVIVDENILEQVSRRDVLHPDVYIKKNFVRKNNLDVNSEAIMD